MDMIASQGSKTRMIVLIPDGVTHVPELAQKILWLSMTECQDILLLGIASDDGRILSLSRTLTTLKATITTNWLYVAAKLTTADDWLTILKTEFQSGDIIVCHEEQIVKIGFLEAIPASEFLRGSLQTTVKTINGFYHPQRIQAREWALNVLFWAGCLAILAGFTSLEISLDQGIHGTARSVIFILLVLVEIGSFLAWGRIRG
jgi:hypothetical protein